MTETANLTGERAVTYLSSYMLALTNKFLLLLSVFAFGVCSLVAILVVFAIDSNAFVSDKASELAEG